MLFTDHMEAHTSRTSDGPPWTEERTGIGTDLVRRISFSQTRRTRYNRTVNKLAVHILQHYIMSTVQVCPCIFFFKHSVTAAKQDPQL
jgi:hypothetical protein